MRERNILKIEVRSNSIMESAEFKETYFVLFEIDSFDQADLVLMPINLFSFKKHDI